MIILLPLGLFIVVMSLYSYSEYLDVTGDIADFDESFDKYINKE